MITLDGVMSPACSAAENGDDLEDRARFVGLGEGEVVDRLLDAGHPDAACPSTGSVPRTPGCDLVLASDASARISPVFTSITTADARDGVGGGQLPGEVAFGHELQRRVEGQLESDAGLGLSNHRR